MAPIATGESESPKKRKGQGMQQSIIETRHMKAIKTEMGWVPPVDLKDMLASRGITEDNRDVIFEPFIIDEGVSPESWHSFVSKQSECGGKLRLYNYPVILYWSITSQQVIGLPMPSQAHCALSRAIEDSIRGIIKRQGTEYSILLLGSSDVPTTGIQPDGWMRIRRVIPTRPRPTFVKLCRIGVEILVSQRPEGPGGIVQKINDSYLHMKSPIELLLVIEILDPRNFIRVKVFDIHRMKLEGRAASPADFPRLLGPVVDPVNFPIATPADLPVPDSTGFRITKPINIGIPELAAADNATLFDLTSFNYGNGSIPIVVKVGDLDLEIRMQAEAGWPVEAEGIDDD
jgi:hypothetical protein